MGYPITKITDYSVGRFALPNNSISAKSLVSDITDNEEDLLDCLLGVELSALLIGDLDAGNIPQTERFTNIWNKFTEEEGCELKKQSKGIVDMIKSFIFFYNGRRGTNRLTMAGVKKTASENGTNGALSGTELSVNYNRGVRTYQAIQDYICENISVYPEFKGSKKEYKGRI